MFLTQSQFIISFITITCLLLFGSDSIKEKNKDTYSDYDILSPSVRNDKKLLKFYFCIMLIGLVCFMYFNSDGK